VTIVDLIAEHIEEHGYPPTVRELGKLLNRSPASVHKQLKKAEAEGLIERLPDKPRAIRIRRSTT
jgi:repressor LexA